MKVAQHNNFLALNTKFAPDYVCRGVQLITSKSTAQQPEYSYKDVCLLPRPEHEQVPNGSVKASLVESGLYVDAFQLDKAWSEV